MKLTQWIIEQAARQTQKDMEALRNSNDLLKRTNEGLQQDNHELRERIRAMAPEKQFRAVSVDTRTLPRGQTRELRILRVYSTNGVTTIETETPT